MENFTVKTDVSGKWVSTAEVETLVAALVAKCAEVAAKNPNAASEAVKDVKVEISWNNNFFISKQK